MSDYSISYSAELESSATDIAVGQPVVINDSGAYLLSTLVNRTALGSRKTSGIARTPGDATNRAIDIQHSGIIKANLLTLGAGAQAFVRVSAAGALQRVTSPVSADDVVGRCDTAGNLLLSLGAGAPSAVIFDEGTPSENLRSDRATRQSPIDNTKTGIVNLSSDVSGDAQKEGATADYSTISGGEKQEARSSWSTIGGGKLNSIHTTCESSVIAGGFSNKVHEDLGLGTDKSVIAGGFDNHIYTGYDSAIGGGSGNSVQGLGSTVAGGQINEVVGTNGAIGGGGPNQINSGIWGTIPGGGGARTLLSGQFAHAGGMFDVLGDAQFSRYLGRGESINGAITSLLDQEGASFVLPDGFSAAIKVTCIANRVGAAGRAMFVYNLLVHVSGLVMVIDNVDIQLLVLNGNLWAFTVNSFGQNLVASFAGGVGQTVRALVSYEWTQLGGGV